MNKEALARIKINHLLEEAGWRFKDNLVTDNKTERKTIKGYKKLISVYEAKIKKVIDKVWKKSRLDKEAS